ncbi:hypothetical protein J5N97_003708 [Dioscorea zingiberensis]|uniref:DUF7866 domain-containing protein n=1 Tax=Dioscorea zingiberensis TaxID=325984 RepID=A0A9D5HRG3_9LILI|nr:hypothetical protein J5N97_003708 [Dioscorea zingiberensis]
MAKSAIYKMFHLLTLAFILPSFLQGTGSYSSKYHPVGLIEYKPVGSEIRAAEFNSNNSRRILEPFQQCLECRCCAVADPMSCSLMSCCFGIDCNLPDKPYGVCAFVPKTCNCTSCE